MNHPIQRFFRFILGAIMDPISGDLSSARVAGLVCVGVAAVVALSHPTDGSGTVAALIGGGATAFLTRTKSDAGL